VSNLDVEKVASSRYGTFQHQDNTENLETVVRHEPDEAIWGSLLKALGVVGFIVGFAMMIVFAFYMGDL